VYVFSVQVQSKYTLSFLEIQNQKLTEGFFGFLLVFYNSTLSSSGIPHIRLAMCLSACFVALKAI